MTPTLKHTRLHANLTLHQLLPTCTSIVRPDLAAEPMLVISLTARSVQRLCSVGFGVLGLWALGRLHGSNISRRSPSTWIDTCKPGLCPCACATPTRCSATPRELPKMQCNVSERLALAMRVASKKAFKPWQSRPAHSITIVHGSASYLSDPTKHWQFLSATLLRSEAAVRKAWRLTMDKQSK